MPIIRRSRATRTVFIAASAVVLIAGYVMLGPDTPSEPAPAQPAPEDSIALTGVPEKGTMLEKVSEQRSSAAEGTIPERNPAEEEGFSEGMRLLAAAQSSDTSGDLVRARTLYGQALRAGLPAQQHQQTRARLIALAKETLLGPARYKGDPLISTHHVQPGETLSKIAARYYVGTSVLARINSLENVNMIRVGQILKILHGPFHVEIVKHAYRLDVFLQDTLVAEFPVGLGVEGSTPTGQWIVRDKLVNPTYYPPRGGQIVQADDPENPLGERWIGLEGVDGEAVGQLRYGIHGTNEPESIGHSESLGCVRMYNQDVEWLYDLLVVEHSRVLIQD